MVLDCEPQSLQYEVRIYEELTLRFEQALIVLILTDRVRRLLPKLANLLQRCDCLNQWLTI